MLKAELKKKEAFMDQYLCDRLATGAAQQHRHRMQLAQATLQRAAAAEQQDKPKQAKPAAAKTTGKGSSRAAVAGPFQSTLPKQQAAKQASKEQAARQPGQAAGSKRDGRPRPRRSSTGKTPADEQQQTVQTVGAQAVAAAAVVIAEPVASSGIGETTNSSSSSDGSITGQPSSYTLWELYCDYWHPFGEVLTAMEAEGVRVNR